MSKLTLGEQKELIRLMKKMTIPAPLEVFYTWCEVFGIIAAELVLLRYKNGKPEIFLEYRKDRFFTGWHVQGSVELPNERITDTLKRVIKNELQGEVTTPKFFNWFERVKGKKNIVGFSKRGHELAFVFIAEPKKMPKETATRKFFPLNKIPKNTIKFHAALIKSLVPLYKNKKV